MKTKLLLLLLVTVVLTSCKNEKAIDNTEGTAAKPAESKISIVLDMVVPEDDVFQIFYTEDGTANCAEERSVKTVVKGSPASQKIKFDFSEDLAMNYLRIDVGENPKQGQVKVNGMVYKYFDKTFEIKGSEFFTYFAPSTQVEIDVRNATFTPISKGEVHDPTFYTLDPLKLELEKLLK